MTLWTLVVPVKGTANSKSRLGGTLAWRTTIARAMALDAVEAALGSQRVGSVIVVTGESWAPAFVDVGAAVVSENAEAGLGAAVAGGIHAAGSGPVAVMLGDVPALTPAELTVALDLAALRSRAMVADRDATGTVLIAAVSGSHEPAFGAGSAAAHVARGYEVLDIAETSGLRNDVDTVEQLAAIASRVGPRTAALLSL